MIILFINTKWDQSNKTRPVNALKWNVLLENSCKMPSLAYCFGFYFTIIGFLGMSHIFIPFFFFKCIPSLYLLFFCMDIHRIMRLYVFCHRLPQPKFRKKFVTNANFSTYTIEIRTALFLLLLCSLSLSQCLILFLTSLSPSLSPYLSLSF